MIETIPPVGAADPTSAAGQGADAKPAAGTTPAPPSDGGQPGTQLTVEQDGKGVFVYRLVDTVTGRILAEVPREKVDQLRNSPDYTAGALVSTSA